MKRTLPLLLILFIALCGCVQEKEMYIAPAQLTQQEKDIANLLGANLDQRIFDFQADDTIRRMEVNAYELIDGKWEMFYGGGGASHTDPTGRIALDFDNIAEGLRIAVQSEHRSGSTGLTRDAELDTSGMHIATSLLSQRTPIVYEQEIPLAIQVYAKGNQIYSYDPTYFHQPLKYAEGNYDHVYAVTVTFSQIPLQ
ncbi:MAG: hypothetical protein J6J12_06460 [Oscillospiraceae bacterium]|nr:hypothetical protein [Oscillospiraceae bacterium]